jgi:hypothetical protein
MHVVELAPCVLMEPAPIVPLACESVLIYRSPALEAICDPDNLEAALDAVVRCSVPASRAASGWSCRMSRRRRLAIAVNNDVGASDWEIQLKMIKQPLRAQQPLAEIEASRPASLLC